MLLKLMFMAVSSLRDKDESNSCCTDEQYWELYWCVGQEYLKYLLAYHSFLKFDMLTLFQL